MWDAQWCSTKINVLFTLKDQKNAEMCKDPSTNLWTLPLGRKTAQYDQLMPVLSCPNLTSSRKCPSQVTDTTMTHVACFTHTVHSKANSVKFAHQSLCCPRLSTLLKAIIRGFLKGCPNLTSTGFIRYLNSSPALAKGHMKHPHQGI